MWILVEGGQLFAGDLDSFNTEMDLDPPLTTEQDVIEFCEREQWTVKIYNKQEETWN